MKKRYLKTIEDIEALRNTDTKIYSVRCSSFYHKFVNGVLCFFSCEDKLLNYNSTLDSLTERYIEVKDEQDYIGKLGWSWDDDKSDSILAILECFDNGMPKAHLDEYYEHFRPLTPEEVEKYTGYKVVKED
jgi:hypothetical protein